MMRTGSYWLQLMFCAFVSAASLRPDTAHFAAQVDRFRHHKVEYPAIQREYAAWIDARMKAGTTIAQMNDELKAANLVSDNSLRAIDNFPLKDAPGIVAIRFGTHAGDNCNLDETAMLYQREPLKLLTTLNAEQVYKHGHQLSALAFGGGLIASSWVASGCASNWNGNIFRIDNLTANLFHKTALAFEGEARAAVSGDIVSFEYVTDTRDIDVNTRPAIERYQVQGSTITRIAPIAASYGGFIEEWIDQSDTEAARWSTPEAAARHHAVAAKIGKDFFGWSRVGYCDDSLREIAMETDDTEQTIVFAISGTHPDNLRMVAVRDKLTPTCKRVDVTKDFSIVLNEPR